MGTLLMNLKGEVLGMNIARVERTRSYALLADILTDVIARLIKDMQDVQPPDVKPKPIEEDF